jgi:C1A family cysteine protease
MESAYSIANGKLPRFSEQHLVQCRNPQNCDVGGNADWAFNVAKLRGVADGDLLPYKAKNDSGGDCAVNVPVTKLPSWVKIEASAEAIKSALQEYGVCTINVWVPGPPQQAYWANYASGVLRVEGWNGKDTNHAVNLVGWGTDPKGGPYWLIRNSWNARWGNKGYIKLSTEKGGVDLGSVACATFKPQPAESTDTCVKGDCYDASSPGCQNIEASAMETLANKKTTTTSGEQCIKWGNYWDSTPTKVNKEDAENYCAILKPNHAPYGPMCMTSPGRLTTCYPKC